MLKIFIKKQGEESLREIDEPVKGAWIDVFNPNPSEKEFLRRLGVPEDFITSCLDPDEKPRLDEEDKVKLVILRVPYIDEGNLETIALGIILTNNHIITMSSERVQFMDSFFKTQKDFFTTKKTRFIFQLFWTSIKRFLSYLSHIDTALDIAEEKIARSIGTEEIIRTMKVQRTLTYFKLSTKGNQRIMEKILGNGFVKIYQEDEDVLEDIIIDNEQAMEMIDTYLRITANMMNAYEGIVGNNLNRVMKLLAVLSISMGVPTLIASMYGMNLSLPLQSNPLAFWILTALSVVLGAAVFYAMLRLK